jgi:small ligand-binding sensory domain FIST
MSGFPAVKWKTECAIAVFLGTRPSAGYSVSVQKVVRRGSSIEVTVKERKPAAGDLTAQVITSPYTVIACNCKGVPLKEILMLKLIDAAGRTLVERPAWSYRLMKSSKKGPE